MYNDDYPTCEATYATLRIYSGDKDPDEVSRVLGLEPTSLQRRGGIRNPHDHRPVRIKLNGWFLCSQGEVASRDSRRHLDWILERIGPLQDALGHLRDDGSQLRVSCYWLSSSGHGGPVLSPEQMRKLADLGLECWFDVYFLGKNVENPISAIY